MRYSYLTCLLLLCLGTAHAQTISGPTSVYTNQSYNYTFNNGTVYADGLWAVTNGTDQNETISGSLYTLTATFTSAGSATVKFKNGATTIATLNVTVTYAPPVPNATTNISYTCGTTTVTRTNSPPSGTDWYWETVNNGTSTSLGNGTSVNITTNNTTLYLRARQTASPNTWSVSSQSIGTITVYTTTPTAAPTAGTTSYNVCNNGSTIISATAAGGGDQVRWYSSATGGTLLGTGSSFTTPSLTATNYYYAASAIAVSGCEYGTRTQIDVNVTPVAVATVSNKSICSSSDVALSISNSAHLSPITYAWTLSGNSNVSGASTGSISPGSYSGTVSQTLSSTNGTSSGSINYVITPTYLGCQGTSATATVTVNPSPAAPTGTLTNSACTGSSVSVTPTLGTNANTLQWNDGASHTGTTVTVSSLSSTTSLSVYGYNSTTTCASLSAATVTFTAIALPTTPAAVSPLPIYVHGVATLSSKINDTNTAMKTKWYNVASGGTPLQTNSAMTSTYNTSDLTSSQAYYVSANDTITGCESVRTEVDVSVLPATGPNTSVTVQNVRISDITDDSGLSSLTEAQQAVQQSYYDGLQREVQRIAQKSSPAGNDIVAPFEYDSYGRTSKNYLPYTATASVAYRSTYATDQFSYYLASGDKIVNDSAAISIENYEFSPLGRLTEQGGVGKSWQPKTSGTSHTTKISYSYNTGATSDPKEEVRLFASDGTSSGYYAANTLSRAQSTDANGYVEIVYTDDRGRVMARKKQLDESIGGSTVNYLETYYVYDDMDRLKYALPPKAVAALKAASWSLGSTILDNLCFQFTYDYRGRVTQKKTPGQAATYIVYDNLNRPVLTQNGFLRVTNQWAFTKYDVRNRTVMTGLYTDNTNTTLSAVQTLANGLYVSGNGTYPPGSFYETDGSTLHGYTNVSFPKTNSDASALTIYNVAYYDNYDFDNSGTDDYSYTSQGLSGEGTQGRAIGRATGSKKLVVGTSTWLYNYVFYDKFGRVIQVRSNNHLSTTVDNLSTIVYDFEGKKLRTKTYHNAGGSNQTTVQSRFTYDNKGRVTQVYQTNNSDSEQQVAQYEYNELGQMVDKKLHNTGGTNFLQSVDMRYNIQGWLTSINNAQLGNDSNATNDDTNDYFGMELLYDVKDNALNNTSDYGGNVSAIKWKGAGASSGATGQKSYNYAYDKSGKLKTATYQKYGTSAWNQEKNVLNENFTYDQNGNIATLARKQNQHGLSGTTVTSSAVAIDSLSYTYSSSDNILTKVTDAGSNTLGFGDGANITTEYTYDADGNLTADKNKGIDSIKYNALGKAYRIKFSDGRLVIYTYDGSGNKVKMAVTVSGTTTTTDYVGGFVYTNSTLSFFASPEGRVVKNGSSLEYQYAIADHQGNTRVVFTSATPTAQATLATFEGDSGDQSSQFSNVTPISFGSANHTAGGSKVVRLNQSAPVGPGFSKKVYPGDKIDMEAYSYYEATSGYGTSNTAVGGIITAVSNALINGGTDAGGIRASGVNSALTAFGTGANQGDGAPAAFLNYILFDQDYKVMDAGWQVVTATSFSKQQVTIPQITVKEAGFIFVYLSYEDQSNNYVYFDDFKVTVTPTNIIQSNDYYAHGLQHNTSWTRDNNSNNFLYNAGSEMNTTTNWYDLPARNYDAALGRFHQVDPLAHYDHVTSPFAYAGNNPLKYNDPTGLTFKLEGDNALVGAVDTRNYTSDWSESISFEVTYVTNRATDASKVLDGRMAIGDYISKYGVKSVSINPLPENSEAKGATDDAELEHATKGDDESGVGGQTKSDTDPKYVEGVLFNRDNPNSYLPAAYFKYTSATGAFRLELYSYAKGMTDIIEMDADGNLGSRTVNALPKMDFIGQWSDNDDFTQIPRSFAKESVYEALGSYADDFWRTFTNGNGYLMTNRGYIETYNQYSNGVFSDITFRFRMDLTFDSHNYNLVLNVNY